MAGSAATGNVCAMDIRVHLRMIQNHTLTMNVHTFAP